MLPPQRSWNGTVDMILHPVLHLLSQDPQTQGVGWEMENQEMRRGQRSNKDRSTGQDRTERVRKEPGRVLDGG